jgi:hypothetical protein
MPETPSLTQTHLKLSFANRETHLFEISPSPEIHRIESEMRYVRESQKVSDALVGKDKFANLPPARHRTAKRRHVIS